VTPDVLRHDGLLRSSKTKPLPVKILGTGEAPKGVTIHAHAFTRSALEKLAAAGSTAQRISWPEGLPIDEAEEAREAAAHEAEAEEKAAQRTAKAEAKAEAAEAEATAEGASADASEEAQAADDQPAAEEPAADAEPSEADADESEA
jgi:hypothetical protein